MLNLSGPIRAFRTIEAINRALDKDGGGTYRKILRETMPKAEDAYREDSDDGFRSHLGASLVGRDCTRELWYTFRWATDPATRKENHEGPCEGSPQTCYGCIHHRSRMRRLYNRGHLEEPRFVALLKMIGCEVWQHDEAGKQFRVAAHNGHFGGSLDSVVRGCPDVAPGVAILGEFKTHNEKSFEKLDKEGVRSAKFEHFVQQQVYMGGFSLPASLYLAVNKNNDELYGEIVPFDQEQYNKFVERGRLVVLAEDPPPKCNPSPGWWKCKWCDHRAVCHLGAEAHRNCRTCIHSQPVDNGQWICTEETRSFQYGSSIPLSKADQMVGCSSYRWIPM